MTDQWAEVREIESQIAEKISEHVRAPWRLRRNERLRRECHELLVLLDAAITKAAAASTRRN